MTAPEPVDRSEIDWREMFPGGGTEPTAPEPVVLTDGEREALAEARHRFWCNSSHHRTDRCRYDVAKGVDAQGIDREVPVIERILADRLAADRAAHEALREAVEGLADAWDDPDPERGDPDRADALRAALAATAPTPPQDAATEDKQ